MRLLTADEVPARAGYTGGMLVDGWALDLIIVLGGCAVLLGLLALYYYFTDPETIDEEEDYWVRHETQRERERELLRERKEAADRVPEEFDSGS